MLLEMLWLTIAILHIGVPLSFYGFMASVANRAWNLDIDTSYEPTISILIPSYNEESMIENKMDNLLKVDYPLEKLEIIFVDSSNDNTFKVIEKLKQQHSQIEIKIIREEKRRGKAKALNQALPYTRGEIVVITDVDCIWDPSVLREAVKLLSNPSIAVVTAFKQPISKRRSTATKAEETYRNYYNVVRVGESKLYSTTISHGELASFKRNLLPRFEESIGADDSGTAMNIIRKGYRSILSPDIVVYEYSSHTWKGRFTQKIRRAQHCIQMFMFNLDLIYKVKSVSFRAILAVEAYLHILNPLLLVVLTLLSIPMILKYWILLIPLTIVFAVPHTRSLALTWILENITLLFALGREIRGEKELVWEKVSDFRTI